MVYCKEYIPHKIEKTEEAHMEELLTEKFLREVRARLSDAMAAWELLAPMVAEADNGKGRDYLAAMNKSFYRLLRLLHHVEACRAESLPRKGTLDLAGLCRKLCRDSEDMARILGSTFDWELSDSSVISTGDAQLLELAILNLLVNAFGAVGAGGRVSLRGGLESGRWTVTVEDDGPGLQEREEPRDPFLKQPGGTGLGLEAVRRTAELHGGVLMLVNKGTGEDPSEGTGVKAVLSLPVRKPKGGQIREPAGEFRGGFVPAMVEFSPLLPAEVFYEDTK